MGVYQPVQRDSQYMLYRISNTPLGVTNLEWSPNSTQLWLNVAALAAMPIWPQMRPLVI